MKRDGPSTKAWKPALACLAVATLGWPQAAPAAAAAEAKTLEEGRPVYPGDDKCPYDLPPHARAIRLYEQEPGEASRMSAPGG